MRVRTAIQVLLVFVLVVLSFSPSVASPAQQRNIIQLNLTSDQFTTMPRRYDRYLNLTFRRSSAEITRYFDTDTYNTQSVFGNDTNLGFHPGSPIVPRLLSSGIQYGFGRTGDNVPCYGGNLGEPESTAYTAVWKYGLAPVWYGGFYMYRGSDGRKVRVCIVRGLSVDCNNEYSFSFPVDSTFAGASLGNTWFSGHSPGEWASHRPNATVPGNSVLWYYGPDAGRLYFPGEEVGDPHLCSGNNTGFLFLSDNGVPVVGQGRIEGPQDASTNYGFHVQMDSVVNAAQSDKFSCAGPIVKSDGTGMFPPACGVMRPSFVTDTNSAPSHWVSFGSFTRSGSLKRFNSESAMRALSNYRKNNRQMLFEISGQRVMGSNATLLVPADASIDSPLVVTIPALSISPGVTSIVAGVVVATSAGKYTIQTINIFRNGNVIQVVIPPDIVREVAEVGGEITVRAIVAGDTGNNNSPTRMFGTLIPLVGGGHIQDQLDWVSKHDAEVPIMEMVEQGWFVPYNGFVSGGWFGICGYTLILSQYPYYRYVADVAQASVRLVPIEAKLVSNPVMRVAVWPDAPQTTGIYVPPETPIPVSTDVPLRGGVEIDTRNVRVAITYTHPISGLVTASVVPERLELMGCTWMPPCGLGWRMSKCRCMPFWTTIPVGTVNKYDMLWQYQTPAGERGCLRHNVSECYVPAITNNQASINADIWLRAVATVSIPVGDETITTTITTQSDRIVYQWTLPLLQETR